MSSKISINNIVGILLGDNFTGDLSVELNAKELRIKAGKVVNVTSNVSAEYQLAEQEVVELPKGKHTFKVEGSALISIKTDKVATETAKPERKVVGGQSSAPNKRRFD